MLVYEYFIWCLDRLIVHCTHSADTKHLDVVCLENEGFKTDLFLVAIIAMSGGAVRIIDKTLQANT